MFLFYKKIKDKIWANWLFFILVAFWFLISSVFQPDTFLDILRLFISTIYHILPILWIIYLIIFLFGLVWSNKKFSHFLEHWNYGKKLLLSVLVGIISSWPIYLRYGFLKKLHSAGLSLGHITAFSYARAIKIPLFPMMIVYFGLKFTLIFSGVLFVLSFVQAFIIDFLNQKYSFFKKTWI